MRGTKSKWIVIVSIFILFILHESAWCSYSPVILNWVRYSDLAREVPNTEVAILSSVPGASIARSTANTAGQLASELAGMDVFLISEVEKGNYQGEGTVFAPVLLDFVSNGGIAIQCGGGWYGRDVILDAGLITRTYVSTIRDGWGSVELPAHPLAYGFGSAVQMANATEYWTTMDPSVDIVASYSSPNHGILMASHIGDGWVIGIGYDYYDRNPDADRMIANAVTIPEPAAILLFALATLAPRRKRRP